MMVSLYYVALAVAGYLAGSYYMGVVRMTRAFQRDMWRHSWGEMWSAIGFRFAMDGEPARPPVTIKLGDSETDTGLVFLPNSRRIVLVIRGQSIGTFDWSTRAELAESFACMSLVLGRAAEYAAAPATGASNHPIDRPDVVA